MTIAYIRTYSNKQQTESQQNSTSVKQQNSVSTQQRNSKTVTSVSQYFSQSVLQSVSASVSQCFSQSVFQLVSTEFSQYWRQSVSRPFWIRRPAGLPFLIGFVSDVSFGNGWFASSDWPANKRERDVIFDRFWVPGTLYVSGLGKLCFPLREIDFVTENSLPARGGKTPPKSSFFTGHPMCETGFNRRRVSGTLRSKMGTWKA